MRDFKVGDKVIRTADVSNSTALRTGVQKGSVYTVESVRYGCITLTESLDPPFTFKKETFNLLNPEDAPWDINEALRLRGLAVQAIQEYNTYLLQQPLLEAIDIPPIK